MNTNPQPTAPSAAPPPGAIMMEMITGFWLSQAVATAAMLNVADHLADGPLPIADLAKKTETNADALYRVLRALAANGVFTESGPRVFAQTPLSETLRDGVPGSVRAMALFQMMEFHWTPWAKLLHSVRTGEPAFDEHHGRDFFEHCGEDEEANAAFNNAMTSFAGHHHAAAAESYDFAGIGTLMDVGGGHGGLLASILRRNPDMRGMLLDLPHVVRDAPVLLEKRKVADRVTIIPGSFFDPIPAGADAIIMSTVLHDWSDAKATAILKRCHEALPKGGRVLLVENVIPEGNGRFMGKMLDLEMLVCTPGGRERTEQEWRDLFAGAGLRMSRVIKTSAPISVIEAFKD